MNLFTQAQKAGAGQTSLKIYGAAAQMRRLPAFQNSRIIYSVVNDHIFSYIRNRGKDAYLVALNLGSRRSVDDYTTELEGVAFQMGGVMLNTGNFDGNKYHTGAKISIDSIVLEPGQGLVLKLTTLEGIREEL